MAIPRELVTEALELPADDREQLVHALLDSFGEGNEVELPVEQQEALDEALAEADRGKPISGDELLAQMRQIRRPLGVLSQSSSRRAHSARSWLRPGGGVRTDRLRAG